MAITAVWIPVHDRTVAPWRERGVEEGDGIAAEALVAVSEPDLVWLLAPVVLAPVLAPVPAPVLAHVLAGLGVRGGWCRTRRRRGSFAGETGRVAENGASRRHHAKVAAAGSRRTGREQTLRNFTWARSASNALPQ